MNDKDLEYNLENARSEDPIIASRAFLNLIFEYLEPEHDALMYAWMNTVQKSIESIDDSILKLQKQQGEN